MFSLKNTAGIGPVKMRVLDKTKATLVHKDALLWFGYRFKICSNAGTNTCSKFSLDNFYEIPSALEDIKEEGPNLLAGGKHFTPTDIEVFYIGK